LGQLGMNVVDLYDLTPKMFYNAQQGLFDMWKTEDQNQWERSRWLACVLLNPHVKKNMQPKDITRFPWESAKNKMSKKEMEKVRNEAMLFKKINEKKMKQNG
tara:strand:+ start:3243 stop:3548 length:306 start_codon:yes stop_codon:yes gene_type:complete